MAPTADPRLAHLVDLPDLELFHTLEIQHFFEIYRDLEPGNSSTSTAASGPAEAEAAGRRSGLRPRSPGAGNDGPCAAIRPATVSAAGGRDHRGGAGRVLGLLRGPLLLEGAGLFLAIFLVHGSVHHGDLFQS